MSISGAISHMNEGHEDAIINMVKHFAKHNNVQAASIQEIKLSSMVILVNNTEKVVITLPLEITDHNVKEVLINMSKEARINLPKPEALDLTDEINEHIGSLKSIILATTDHHHEPYATYAPYAFYDNNYYIYISSVTEHCDNLKQNNKLEVMFLEDESKSTQVFARKRVRFKAIAEFLPRDYQHFDTIMEAFEKKEAKSVALIRKMTDFTLVKIKFTQGRYVKNFGQIFGLQVFNNKFMASPITGGKDGKGHQFPSKKPI
ncbi:HugZ family heme oxygenase [Candidatus Hepatincolaceae symbiont of Richtersius coronifer]